MDAKYYHTSYSCKGKTEDGYKEYVSDTEYVEELREREEEHRKENNL